LQTLSLEGCTGVSDLTPLKGLTSLQTLWLDRCTGVSNLSPLNELTSLQMLWLKGCTGLKDDAVATLQAKLPKLIISR
jgi:internalin A